MNNYEHWQIYEIRENKHATLVQVFKYIHLYECYTCTNSVIQYSCRICYVNERLCCLSEKTMSILTTEDTLEWPNL